MVSQNTRPETLPLLVAVGASAGGLEAITRLVSTSIGETGMAIVIVQHLSPDYKSMMTQLLTQRTELRVRAAQDGMQVESETVYVIEPKTQLLLDGVILRVEQVPQNERLMHPINDFFDSVAGYPGDVAGVILSGTGTDGAQGLVTIKQSGGTVVVQKPEEAGFDGMPKAALRMGVADLVLPAADILPELLALQRTGPEVYFGLGDARGNAILQRILDLLNEASGVDFGSYKSSTLLRRIQRRMQALGITDPRIYAERLRSSPKDIQALYDDLLIGVTRFFRDPGAITALTELVLPRVLARAGTGPIRAWVAGCSTGEEAYTVAILIAEGLASAGLARDFRVFATDIDGKALESAKAGEFSNEAIKWLPASVRTKYFLARGQRFLVRKEIREHLLFSRHNLIEEPPFTRLDFISCRNLLIYLKPVVQQQIIQTFASALIDNGVLWLGSSETIGDAEREFKTLDPRWRIFQARTGRNRRMLRTTGVTHLSPAMSPRKVTELRRTRSLLESLENALLGYAPPTLIINSDFQLVYRYGSLDGVLTVPTGRMSLDVREMLPKELSAIIYTAFSRAREAADDLQYRSLRVDGGEAFDLRARLLPAGHDGEDLLALMFENRRAHEIGATEVIGTQVDGDLEVELITARRELQETRANLQATIEELESTNEALQSTNEELIAANEELQSTNEELHSVNEELHTVNAEHQDKVDELMSQTQKLDDVLSALDLGVAVLDDALNVQHFNVAATRYFSLIGRDLGRPLAHLSHRLEYPDLLDRCSDALREDIETTRTTTAGDRAVLVHICPRRRRSDVPAGAIVTVADISDLVTARREAGDFQRAFDMTGLSAVVIDADNRIQAFNTHFAERLGRDPDHLAGQDVLDLISPADQEIVTDALARTRAGERWSGVVQALLPTGDSQWALVDLFPSPRVDDAAKRAVLSLSRPFDMVFPFDPTAALAGGRGAFWVWDPETQHVTASRGLAALWGLTADTFEGLEERVLDGGMDRIRACLAEAARTFQLVTCRATVQVDDHIRVNEIHAYGVRLHSGDVRVAGLTRLVEDLPPAGSEV